MDVGRETHGFSYLATRALAALIDYGLAMIAVDGYFFTFGTATADGGYEVHGCLLNLVPIVIWLALLPLPEAIWGRGLGKAIAGLRVAMGDDLVRPDLAAVAKRHFAALFELFLCFGIVPLIVAATTKRGQRLGDLWADTYVVMDQASP